MCEKEYSTKTIKVEFKTNVHRLRRELGIYTSRGGGGQHCIVAHSLTHSSGVLLGLPTLLHFFLSLGMVIASL